MESLTSFFRKSSRVNENNRELNNFIGVVSIVLLACALQIHDKVEVVGLLE